MNCRIVHLLTALLAGLLLTGLLLTSLLSLPTLLGYGDGDNMSRKDG